MKSQEWMSALGHKQTFCDAGAMSALPPCLYYFFLAVVVIRYETRATARWAPLFIVRAFFDDTVTVAVWTSFHACASWDATHRRDFICRCFTDPTAAEGNQYSVVAIRLKSPGKGFCLHDPIALWR